MEQKPVAWMRKWAFDGEKEYKEVNPRTGRMALARKFLYIPVSIGKCLPDDIPLYAGEPEKETK